MSKGPSNQHFIFQQAADIYSPNLGGGWILTKAQSILYLNQKQIVTISIPQMRRRRFWSSQRNING